MTNIDRMLLKLARLVQDGRYEELETESIEIKPVPSQGNEWRELNKTINAFLNSRGGVVIFGVKEEGQGPKRKYVFSGWQEHGEPKLKELARQFTDRKGVKQDLSERFPPAEIKPFLDGRIALLYVDELAADRKYVFLDGVAYKRLLTGDHRLSESEIEAQEEFKEEAAHARELQLVADTSVDDVDIDKLNEYIQHLNRPTRIETIKADLAAAEPFLRRKSFLKDANLTTLGVLVCGKHPEDRLGFRCQVHGYVDVPNEIARDKQDFADNIIPLMEASLAFILRNIQVGVSAAGGGTSVPEYPEELLRETVNNALAHRDYSINKQASLVIAPGKHICIRNPGSFRKHLVVEVPDAEIPLRRILPEARPRNPKLADVLRVFRKWEGRGIGMGTLVNLCLENRIDLPYYRFHSEEVSLYLCGGKLLDERMQRYFESFDGFVEEKLRGSPLTESQKLVLTYLLKSEWAGAGNLLRYTILLTSDNNHFEALGGLEQAGLIEKHPSGSSIHPVYVAHRTLATRDYLPRLREFFGGVWFDTLDAFPKSILEVVWRFQHYSKDAKVSAKQAARVLWDEQGSGENISAFDAFYRRVRYFFNRLEKEGYLRRDRPKGSYLLDGDFKAIHL